MSTLTIQPVVYEGRRLDEVGEGIITWYEYLDAYASTFCDDCNLQLGIKKIK